MAATAQGTALTEIHRLAQARLSAETVQQMFRVWSLLDPTELDRTTDPWLQVATAIVKAQHGTSAALAAEYLRLFRAIEAGEAVAFTMPGTPPLSNDAVRTSLLVTGPVKVKQAMGSDALLTQAVEAAQVASAGAASRHALAGGRDLIDTVRKTDPAVRGYARITSGKPCAFCAMLASRGPVYESEASATVAVRDGGAKKFHDHCHCSTELIYSDGSGWPPGTQDFSQLWESSTSEFYGHNKAKAFRRAYEATLR